jgi:hypothetical protein
MDGRRQWQDQRHGKDQSQVCIPICSWFATLFLTNGSEAESEANKCKFYRTWLGVVKIWGEGGLIDGSDSSSHELLDVKQSHLTLLKAEAATYLVDISL